MTRRNTASRALDEPTTRAEINRCGRGLIWLIGGFALAITTAAITTNLVEPGQAHGPSGWVMFAVGSLALALTALPMLFAVRLIQLVRRVRILRRYRWREVTLVRQVGTGPLEVDAVEPPQIIQLMTDVSPPLTVAIAGPESSAAWHHRRSIVRLADSTRLLLVKGPMRTRAAPISRWRRRLGGRSTPAQFHDVAVTPCWLGREGIESDGRDPGEWLFITAHELSGTSLWLNDGRQIGWIVGAATESARGLLAPDGRLVIERTQHVGVWIYSSWDERLATACTRDLAMRDRGLVGGGGRHQLVVRSADGELLASKTVCERAHRHTTSLVSLSTSLDPASRAVVLLHLLVTAS